MAWVHYQKRMCNRDQISINKRGILCIPKALRQKDNVNIFFDDEKKLIGLTFCEKQSGSRKIPSNGYLDISPLLKILKIKITSQKELILNTEDNMRIFSYAEFLQE